MEEDKSLHSVTLEGSLAYGNLLKWSEDNIIAVATMEGVHLFDIAHYCNVFDDPVTMKRDVIRPPNDVLKRDFGVDVHNGRYNFSSADWYYLALDRIVGSGDYRHASFNGFREIAWSPKGLGENRGCFLAALTAESRIMLFGRYEGSWIRTAELSQMVYDHLKENKFEMIPPVEEDDLPYGEELTEFRRKCYAAATVRIVWSQMFKNSNSDNFYSYLFSSQKDGSIAIWKIKASSELSNNNAELVITFNGEVGSVSSLNWTEIDSKSGYLIVGGSKGKCSIFQISLEDTHNIISYKTILESSEDRISVSAVSSFKKSEKLHYIICCKADKFIVWKAEGETFTKICQKCVGFITEVTGIDFFPGGFVVCKADGTANKIEIDCSDEDFDMKLGNNFTNAVEDVDPCFGIALSPNKSVACVLKCIKLSYNHLIVREPISMLFYGFDSVDDASNKLQQLMNCSEDLSSVRDILFYFCNDFMKTEKLPSIILSMTKIPKEEFRNESTCTLHLLRWLYSFASPLEEVEGNETSAMIKEMTKKRFVEVENAIIERIILNFFKSVKQSSSDNSKFDERMRLIASWFKKTGYMCNSEEKRLFEEFGGKDTIEKCKLCQSDVPLESVRHGKCTKGHIFGRCMISLVVCDLFKKRKCQNCRVTANLDAVDFLGIKTCPLCQEMFNHIE